MLLVSTFSKQNSVISLEESVLVLELFTTATMKLRVKMLETESLVQLNGAQSRLVLICFMS